MKKPSILILAILALAFGAFVTTESSMAAGNIKPYPKDTCLVTGNKLGSMGKPVAKVYDVQEVKFCCKACVKKFEANQPLYLSKL